LPLNSVCLSSFDSGDLNAAIMRTNWQVRRSVREEQAKKKEQGGRGRGRGRGNKHKSSRLADEGKLGKKGDLFPWKEEVKPLNTALVGEAPVAGANCRKSAAPGRRQSRDDSTTTTTTTTTTTATASNDRTRRRKSNEMGEKGKQREATMNRKNEPSRQRETRGNK
ncbi:hypothetical protein K0M31_003895, partial [Melipona bicolor]